jgi:ketosteroid isomerase-like protein
MFPISIAVSLVFMAGVHPPAQGTPQSPSVTDEWSNLNTALANHDPAAFQQLLAPDASFTLPAALHGIDAIVKAWAPFLVAGGNTMTLTAAKTVTAASGDLAYVFGSFAVTGKSSGAPVMDALGEYVAVWRHMDGRWRLAIFSGVSASAGTRTGRGGLAGYRFGMTLDEVRQVQDCRPYTNVSQTGGLECANFMFEGRRVNISFLFSANQLRRIQLWMYEGNSEALARDAVAAVIQFLQKTRGGVTIGALPGVAVTEDQVMGMLKSGSGATTQFDLSTPAGPETEVWYGRVVHLQDGYFVFLLIDPRQSG